MKRWIPILLPLAMVASYSTLVLAQPHDPPKPGEHDHDKDDKGHDKDHSDDLAKKLHDWEDGHSKAHLAGVKDMKAWEAAREKRAEEERKAMEGIWPAEFLRRPECQPELSLYAERVARLERIIEIGTPAQVARARAILERENRRHAHAMEALRMKLGIALEVH